ncbi:MAG: 7TM diverse intracellular signaling domain-containing protein [Oligoflexus sp.]
MQVKYYLIAILISLFSKTNLHAKPIAVNQTWNGQSIGQNLEIFLDHTGEKKIEEIVTSAEFTPSTKDVPNFGFTSDIIWAKFRLENPDQNDKTILIEYKYASVDYVSLYSIIDDEIIALTLGDKVPFSRRLITHRYPVFEIQVPPGIHEYYVRVETKGTTILPLFLWDWPSFRIFALKDNLALGLLFGVLTAMTLYNLFLFFSFRSKVYFYYMAYLAAFMLHALAAQGIGQLIFSPDAYNHWLSNEGFLIFAEISTIFMVFFAIHFLNIKTRHPWLYKFFLVHRTIGIIDIINIQFYSYEIGAKVANLNVAIGMTLMIAAGLMSCYKRYRPAYFYTLAWIIFLVGSISMVLKYQGVLPVNLLTEWANLGGAAVEAILLSIALGDRMNYYRSKAEFEIRSLNTRLKEHIERVEEIVGDKTRDIRSILRNIQQGVFMIGNNAKIHREYSIFLPELFGRPVSDEVSAVAYMFENSSVNEDQYSLIKESLDAIIGNHYVNYEANRSNLPREFHIHIHERKRILEVDWSPIVDENETINKILVCVRDVTDIRRLAREADEHKDKMDLIERVIDLNPEKFDHFYENTKELFEKITEAMGASAFGPEQLLQIYRHLHTLKGVSRVFGFHDLSNSIHQTENTTQLMLQTKDNIVHKKELWITVSLLKESFEKLYDINYHLLGRKFATKDHKDGDFVSFINSINEFIATVKDQGAVLHSPEFIETMIGEFFFNMSYLVHDIEGTLTQQAEKMGMRLPSIHIHHDVVHFLPQSHNLLKNMLLHLINNSMAHGFKDSGQRVIDVDLKVGVDSLAIIYQDSGKGLNINAIREQAIQKGLLGTTSQASDLEIAQMIFSAGFSMKDDINELAGRGIGLNAVKDMLEKSSCGIDIRLNDEIVVESSQEYRQFAYIITLPASLYLALKAYHFEQNAA